MAAEFVCDDVTLCVPYYRQPLILTRQIEEWNKYEGSLRIILWDDGSPEPALPIVKKHASKATRDVLEVYRTDVDIPWAREFARNASSKQASTKWLLHVDIDHVLPLKSLQKLRTIELSPKTWFRFRRVRIGKADETRKKDYAKAGLPDSAERGEVHPHVDSYLIQAKHYWRAGGYDERFCGVLGGGNEFLRRLEAIYTPQVLDTFLHVYTRHVIKDASDWSCDRDTQPGKDLWRKLKNAGSSTPKEWLTLPWSRVA